MAFADLKSKFIETRKVWREDKTNKEARKAFRAAKEAYEAAKSKKRSAKEETSGSPKKKQKKAGTYDEIRAAAKAAKDAWKEDKDDPVKRKAFRAAKAALAEAKADGLAPTPTKSEKPKRTLGKVNDARVYCGNLSFDLDEASLKKFFEPLTITDVYWMQDRKTKQFRGMGFVTFSSSEEAKAAIEKNGEELMGRTIHVDFAKARGADTTPKKRQSEYTKVEDREQPEGCNTIFVGNLPFECEEKDKKIRAFFKGCGKIDGVRWITRKKFKGDAKIFKGCGFITFEDEACVAKAVKLNGNDFLGRPIRLDYADNKKDQST